MRVFVSTVSEIKVYIYYITYNNSVSYFFCISNNGEYLIEQLMNRRRYVGALAHRRWRADLSFLQTLPFYGHSLVRFTYGNGNGAVNMVNDSSTRKAYSQIAYGKLCGRLFNCLIWWVRVMVEGWGFG